MEEQLGDRIRWARLRRRLTQTELARDIHISTNAMNQIERNMTDPRASRVTAIAKKLGVSTDYLLGLSDEEVPRAEAAPQPTPRPRRRTTAPVG